MTSPATARFRSLRGLNRALLDAPPIPDAGRVVPGKGPLKAAIAFVGEQPGDQEDRQGLPFVGPAGALLDATLETVGIDRERCYVTNAVKQFNFVQRGSRRLHRRPSSAQVVHYRWWLAAELQLVAPRVIVALGATAAFALAEERLSIRDNRGPHELLGRPGYITDHPSALLRIPDEADRHAARRRFKRDLAAAARLAGFG